MVLHNGDLKIQCSWNDQSGQAIDFTNLQNFLCIHLNEPYIRKENGDLFYNYGPATPMSSVQISWNGFQEDPVFCSAFVKHFRY